MRIKKYIIPACFMYLTALCFVPEEKRMGKIPDFEPEPYDSTTANLPAIHYGTVWDLTAAVKYRTQDNEIHEVQSFALTSDCARMLALYEAIRKYSSAKQPDITETEKFYNEVECKTYTPPRHGVNIEKTFWEPFSKLYKKSVDKNSDGGQKITPREYTRMMQLWERAVKQPNEEDTHHPFVFPLFPRF